MNAGNQALTIMDMDCDSAVQQATARLRTAGYEVQKSFDLSSALPTSDGCQCDPLSCTCQMVILMVYTQTGAPVTLVFDSDGSQTVVNMANNPQQSALPGLAERLACLLPGALSADTQGASADE